MLLRKNRILLCAVLLVISLFVCGCTDEKTKSAIEESLGNNVEVVTMRLNFWGTGYNGTALFHSDNSDVLFDYKYAMKTGAATSNIALSTYASYIKESMLFQCDNTAVQLCSKAQLLENEDSAGIQSQLTCPDFKIYLYTAVDEPAITYASVKRAVEGDSILFNGDIWVYLISEDELDTYMSDCDTTLRSDSFGDNHAYEIEISEGKVVTSLDKVEKSCKRFKIVDTINTLIGG